MQSSLRLSKIKPASALEKLWGIDWPHIRVTRRAIRRFRSERLTSFTADPGLPPGAYIIAA